MAAEVLVVEDEPDIRNLIVLHLSREGFRCRTAKSGPEALREARAATPDLVILDLRSEEHTSELQSRLHLVCRLLLEKKKKHGIPALVVFRFFYAQSPPLSYVASLRVQRHVLQCANDVILLVCRPFDASVLRCVLPHH